jgi:O-antigen/teichoic acid export membrane protein
VFTTFKSHGVGVFELLVLFIAISFSFVCSLTNIVANVNHQASVKERGLAISSITSLIAVTFLSINNSLDLNGLIISQSLALGIGGLCNSMLFFKKNKQLRPSIISFRFDELRLLAKISMLFMVTQISYLILFTTDRLLIGSLTGFESSAEYDLIYKILSAFLILHGLINAPLWGVYSKRFIRREMALIRNSLANQMKIFSLFLMAIVVCTSLLKYIFCFWLGSQFTYSLVGAVSVALFITIYVWSNVFSIFLNSIDDLKLQVYCSVVGAVVNIPLSMFMVNVLSFGYEGVVMSTIICLLPFATLAPIKVYKITATRKGLYE